MLEMIIPSVLTLLAVGVGFYIGRMPIDANIRVPKRKPKPQPVSVMNRKGEVQEKEEPHINPIVNFQEPE